MIKFKRKVEDILCKIIAALWIVTFSLASVGALIWTIKWIGKLV